MEIKFKGQLLEFVAEYTASDGQEYYKLKDSFGTFLLEKTNAK